MPPSQPFALYSGTVPGPGGAFPPLRLYGWPGQPAPYREYPIDETRGELIPNLSLIPCSQFSSLLPLTGPEAAAPPDPHRRALPAPGYDANLGPGHAALFGEAHAYRGGPLLSVGLLGKTCEETEGPAREPSHHLQGVRALQG